ncbi:MAG: hypothetical protein ACOX6K_04930, partial [Sphaerochaetaceae bacterium]
MKKLICAVLLGLGVIVPVLAGGFVSANDLSAEKLVSNKDIDGFVFKATGEKGITIETIDEVREAEDGEIF